eukprot:282956-Amphidinium_carterae.1
MSATPGVQFQCASKFGSSMLCSWVCNLWMHPPCARKPRRKQRPECHLWADGYGGPLRAEATADELRERAAIVAAMRAATAVQKGRPHVAQRQVL